MNRHPRIDPDCPAPTRAHHGMTKAVHLLGCICPGPGHNTPLRHRRDRTVNASKARTVYPRISSLERALLLRDDLPCAETDLDLWDMDDDPDNPVPPTERAFRETVARAICGGCAHRDPCLQVALERDDGWMLMGGLTPVERRALKRAGAA